MGFGVQGRSPLHQSSTKLTLSTERGERGGEAAAPAGRKLPQEARAARSLCKAKVGEDATRQTRLFSKVTVFAIRYGGGGHVPRRGAGAQPLHQSSTKLTLSTERGERGGEAAAPAGRKLPQEARAARSRGRAKIGVDAMR